MFLCLILYVVCLCEQCLFEWFNTVEMENGKLCVKVHLTSCSNKFETVICLAPVEFLHLFMDIYIICTCGVKTKIQICVLRKQVSLCQSFTQVYIKPTYALYISTKVLHTYFSTKKQSNNAVSCVFLCKCVIMPEIGIRTVYQSQYINLFLSNNGKDCM